MLELTFMPLRARTSQQLTLLDATPTYSAVLAPGGYGGPNPEASSLTYLAIIGQQKPGSLRYATTLYAQPGSSLDFELPGDGLYSCLVLAVPLLTPPLPVLPVGTLFANTTNGLFYRISLSGTPEPFALTDYDFTGLRDVQPPLIPLAEWLDSVLVTTDSQAHIERMLLGYVRTASRNAPQNGQDYGQYWIQAQATLDSVLVLHNDGRLPEAAAQLEALRHLLREPNETQPLLRPQHTDWVEQQTNPTT